MPDRLLVDLGTDGQAAVMRWPDGEFPEEVSRAPLAWPLDGDALEELRWYLEDYLLAPFGVWEEHGPAVQARLTEWGAEVFGTLFGTGPARDEYQRARDRGLEVVFRSAEPGLLGLPWELMRDSAGPVALGAGGVSRSLPVAGGAGTLEVPGGKLRVLMVISRPAGTRDVGYQMVARPLLERLEAVRGEVDLTACYVPRPSRRYARRSSALPTMISRFMWCITYSFTHLGEQTRRLLPAISLLHGIADINLLTAFSAMNGVPARFAGSSEAWTAVLQDATRVGLLTSLGAGIYQIHPALPGYLAAEWQASDPPGYHHERGAAEQALCTASAAYGRWLTRQIESGDAPFAYAVIGLQRRTLGAMLGHALDHHAWDEASGIVRALDKYWDTRGLREEAGAWTDRILDAATIPGQDTPVAGAGARSLWLYTTNRQATRQQVAGQLDQAAQTYERALAYLQGQPETEWTRAGIAVSHHQLGITAEARGRLDEAEDWYRKALAIKEELGDRRSMANTYHHLGNIAQRRRRLDEAEDWYRKAVAIDEELGDRPGMANTYHQLGMTAQSRGRLDDASDWFRNSLAISEELGNRPSLALTHAALGVLAEERGQPVLALQESIRCVTQFDQFPSPMTGSGPTDLARLTRQLGMPALEQAWQQVTGKRVPAAVRDYLTRHGDEDPGGDS